MKNILIVEDDPMIVEIYQKKFSEAGFKLSSVSNGKEILDAIKRNSPDLILLDLIMPGFDGFEVLGKIRADKSLAGMKVIIFSNLSQQENKDKAFKLGANGFLSKTDYEPKELVEEVVRIAKQYEEEQSSEISKSAPAEKNSNGANGGKKILLIEDEDVFIEMFGKKIEEKGFKLTTAQNGAWGVKEAMQKKFDIIVMDMVMPAMNGAEMLSKIRSEGPNMEAPVIALSASSSDEEKKEILKIGAQMYIVKTHITPSELVDKIESFL